MSERKSNSKVIRPLAGYIGGKWYLRSTICPLLDAILHKTYVEPFIGMANVFLGRRKRAPVEVINDGNDDVATLFRVVQRHPQALIDAIRWQTGGRADYDRLWRTPASALTDIERAARFLVLRRLTYSGRDPYEHGFATSAATFKGFDAPETMRRIEALHARLARVTIERLDFADVLKRYDRPGTLFYLDPPYWGCCHFYREGGFTQARFAELATALAALKGRWVMSMNDVAEVRELFGWAALRTVETRYNASVGRGSFATGELLIGSDKAVIGI